MEQLAERVADALEGEVGGALAGVSYYTADGVGHVYRSERAADAYTVEAIDAIVEDLQLEAFGHGAHERRHGQALHATVRIYDDLLDVLVPIDEQSGVAFALFLDGDYRVRYVVERAERLVDASRFERTVLHPESVSAESPLSADE
ncbi:MAG: hypothetical protein ABEJ06_06410 [Haloarculaceae archaeon]